MPLHPETESFHECLVQTGSLGHSSKLGVIQRGGHLLRTQTCVQREVCAETGQDAIAMPKRVISEGINPSIMEESFALCWLSQLVIPCQASAVT